MRAFIFAAALAFVTQAHCQPAHHPSKGASNREAAPCPGADHSWHLLTQSGSGNISLVAGMTQKECETAKTSLRYECGFDEHGQNGPTSCALVPIPYANDGTGIVKAICFQ